MDSGAFGDSGDSGDSGTGTDSQIAETCLRGELANRTIEIQSDGMDTYQIVFYPDSNASLDGPGYNFKRFVFDPSDIGLFTHLALHEFLCTCVRQVGGDLSILATIDEEPAIKALFVPPISVVDDASVRYAAALAGAAADSAVSPPGVSGVTAPGIAPPPPSPGA